MDGLILNLAPTGMIPTKEMNAHVPISMPEIVEDVKQCVALGANILHLHARDEYGQPTYKKEIYARLIGSIREVFPDIVICVSLSGRNFGAFEERSDPLGLTGDLKPDMGSLTLASMNFSRETSVNSPEMIRRLAERMAEAGIKPELEVFDTGMLNYARYLVDKGLIRPPLYFNFILGNIATAQATPAHLSLLMNELPPGSLWTGGGLGAAQLTMNAMGILYGNGVRLGLEDSLWLDVERRHPAANTDLVKRASSMAALFGKRIASQAEVRTALGLSHTPVG
ncbi:MAG: 3-keto-5-aminohexanoate cleavage protein [Methylacidiphilales bacterium]|nr:3-keto-5-aminohexanoate cleavage protein [Candidatus Methylacidiphilales bacterium]